VPSQHDTEGADDPKVAGPLSLRADALNYRPNGYARPIPSDHAPINGAPCTSARSATAKQRRLLGTEVSALSRSGW
jgi:hypothetical protein